MSTTPLSIYGSGSISGGSFNGMEYTVTGNGLPTDASKVSAWLVCSSTKIIPVISTSPTTIVVAVPPFAGDVNCKVNVTIGTTFFLMVYQYRTNSTCGVTVTGSGLSYTFAKTNMTTTYNIDKVELTWLDPASNPTTSKYTLAVSGNTATATYLPAGTYSVRVHSNAYGFAVASPPTVTVNWSADPTNAAGSSVSTSFVGGKSLTVNGAGFVTNAPENNHVTVCGLRAPIVSAT